jgi:IPT/TIG domain
MLARLSVVLLLGSLVAVGAGCNTDNTLKVTGIEPDKGDIEGGTYVRIKGNGFLVDQKGNSAPANAKVYFGTRQGEVIRFASSEELIVQAPGGKVNDTVDVLIIFEGRGELKIPHGFTFVDKHEAPASIDDLNTNKPDKK